MPGALMFSGGKDSFYSYIIFRERYGVDVDYLIFLRPTFASPHELNSHVVYLLGRLLGKRIITASSGNISDVLINLGVDFLIAADIYVWDHLYWLERICENAGVDLVEPLLCRDTYGVVEDAVRRGIEFVIIAINKKVNGASLRNLLGFVVNVDTLDKFLDIVDLLSIDPAGESGEYHSLVTCAPVLPCKIIPCQAKVCHVGRYLALGFGNVLLEWQGSVKT